MPSLLGVRRCALLIGIDEHRSAPSLRGCVNDAKLMSSVLQRSGGFGTDDIRVLPNADATRANILAGLDALRAKAGMNTIVVVHFSGWAVQLSRSIAGEAGIITPWRSSRSDGRSAGPADEYDSALVPHNWDPDVRTSAIRHAEIRDWLSTLPTPNVLVVFDAPFSGGLLGSLAGAPGSRMVFFGASPEGNCYESATEDGVFQGALTYSLCQALLRAEPGVTYRQVFRQVASEVASRVRFQHPVLEGAVDQPVLGLGERHPLSDVYVAAREGKAVVLCVGAAAGVTEQSLWAVYPDGTTEVNAKTEKLGMIEITEVRASDASAQIAFEVGAVGIAPGARAIEEAHNYGEMRLRVALAVPSDRELRQGGATRSRSGDDLAELVDSLQSRLASTEILQLTGAGERADVTLRLVPAGVEVKSDETDRRSFDAPTWVIQDSQARLLTAPRPADSKSAYDLRYQLQRIARYRNVLALSNPNLRGALLGKIDFDVRRRAPDGRWIEAEEDSATGLAVFRAGDDIQLSIKNGHARRIYASVLDFGVSMNLSAVCSGVPIEPGATFRFDTSLYFPRDAQRASGIETLKLVATVYEMDLGSLLLQDGGRDITTRDVGGLDLGSSTELWQLLDMALTGRGPRERRPVQLPPDQEWTTVERVFQLLRTGG